MLIKTHLAITLFGILVLLSSVSSKISFILVALIATYIPDIDSRYSNIGHRFFSRILQFFTKHRGIIHSFSFLFLITLLIALFFPVISLGFFLGYGLHLFADSFTLDGIRAFYPLKRISSGIITTGGKIEFGILWSFVLIDLFLVILRVVSIF